MIILVDMDDVIIEFEKKLVELIVERNPEKEGLFNGERSKFKLSDEFPEIKDLIKEIKTHDILIDDIEPVEGGVEALKKISKKGHDVFICTSPLTNYNTILGKYKWIEKNFGHEWTKKIILTKDKTLIQGDFLIDDNPEVSGLKNPEWEHILFDRPYNKHIKDKKRMDWSNWEEVLGL